MSNNAYQELVTQAWATYTTTQAKYRGSDYTSLLKPSYTALLQQLGGIDAVISDLGKSSPPSTAALNNAEKQFGLLQGSLDSATEVISGFPAIDKKAINKAATLDQAALTKVYAGVQDADDALLGGFVTTVFTAQEAAARAMNVFAANPAMATASKQKTKR